MKTIFIGVILVAILIFALIIINIAIPIGNDGVIVPREDYVPQPKTETQKDYESKIGDNTALAREGQLCFVHLPHDVRSFNSCATEAFEMYGTPEQIQVWNEGLERMESEEQERWDKYENWKRECEINNQGDQQMIDVCIGFGYEMYLYPQE